MALAAPEAASSSALKQMRLCMGTPSGWGYDRNSTNRLRASDAGTSSGKSLRPADPPADGAEVMLADYGGETVLRRVAPCGFTDDDGQETTSVVFQQGIAPAVRSRAR